MFCDLIYKLPCNCNTSFTSVKSQIIEICVVVQFSVYKTEKSIAHDAVISMQ